MPSSGRTAPAYNCHVRNRHWTSHLAKLLFGDEVVQTERECVARGSLRVLQRGVLIYFFTNLLFIKCQAGCFLTKTVSTIWRSPPNQQRSGLDQGW